MFTILYWRNTNTIEKYFNGYGDLDKGIVVIDSDGEIRESRYDKGNFYCLSDGEAYEYVPMDPQPTKFAFKNGIKI